MNRPYSILNRPYSPMNRPYTTGLLQIAQILEKRHFSEEKPTRPSTYEPTPQPTTQSPRFQQGAVTGAYDESGNVIDIPFYRYRQGILGTYPSKSDEKLDEQFTASRIGFVRTLDARARLAQAKRVRAQSIREESLRNRVKRKEKLAEEQATLAMKTRSRMDAWALERRKREAADKRFQQQREASEIIRKGEEMLAAHVQQQEELERLRSLKERMKDMDAKKLLPPPLPVNFNTFKAPGETFGQMIFRLEMLKKQKDDQMEIQLAKNRQALLQKVEKELKPRKKYRPSTSVPPMTTQGRRRQTEAEQAEAMNRQLVRETRAEEMTRMVRELNVLDNKYRN